MKHKIFLEKNADNWPIYERNCVVSKLINELKITEVRRTYKGKHIRYYIKQWIGLGRLFNGEDAKLYIYLGESAEKFFKMLDTLSLCYYGVNKLLKDYQYIYAINTYDKDALKEGNGAFRLAFKKVQKLNLCELYACVPPGATISNIETDERLDDLLDYAVHLLHEIRHFKIDVSGLEKTYQYKEYEQSLLSPEFEHALMVGGMFLVKGLVKAAANSVGGNVDLDDDMGMDIPADFDGHFKMPDDFDFDGLDLDLDGTDAAWAASINSNFDGVSFGGRSYSGFIDLDRTISVPVMGGGGNSPLHLYKKLGSSIIYVSDGSCTPVSTSGSSWISVGSHNFKISDIKSKI